MSKGIEIKSWYSPDIENSDFENFNPEKPEDIRFSLEIKIGDVGLDEGDRFKIMVVNPYAAREHNIRPRNKYEKFVFINNYNWDKLRLDIENMVASCDNGSLEESIENLLGFLNWEYEYKLGRS